MNAVVTTPDVHLFVAAVRERLVDLTPDEREELVGGLEADMSDLVEERGVDALPEPAAYAAELRAAAGFTPVARATSSRSSVGVHVGRALDATHARWDALVTGLPGDPWGLTTTLRPVWWVLRAYVAVQLLDLFWGSGGYNLGLDLVPTLSGWGLSVLVVAVLVSVQLGRGRLWPGTPGAGTFARVLLLVLNVFAVVMTPVVAGNMISNQRVVDAALSQGPVDEAVSAAPDGLSWNGRQVRNVFPYDAQGRPLVGVQLVDQDGRRLPVAQFSYDADSGVEATMVPWMNGRTPLFSVFPLLVETRDAETGEPTGSVEVQQPPFASLPPVTLEGVTPSTVTTPSAPASPAATPGASGSASPTP